MRRILHDGKLAYFETTYRRFPADVRGLDWSGVYFQKTRFEALVDGMGTADSAESILDVG